MQGDVLNGVIRAIRTSADWELPEKIEPSHQLVSDLGFDSMGVVMLGLCLEEELGRPVLLDGWIARHPSPERLTVASLAEYLEGVADAELQEVG